MSRYPFASGSPPKRPWLQRTSMCPATSCTSFETPVAHHGLPADPGLAPGLGLHADRDQLELLPPVPRAWRCAAAASVPPRSPGRSRARSRCAAGATALPRRVPPAGVHGRLPAPHRRPRHRARQRGVERLGPRRPPRPEPPAQRVALRRGQVDGTRRQAPQLGRCGRPVRPPPRAPARPRASRAAASPVPSPGSARRRGTGRPTSGGRSRRTDIPGTGVTPSDLLAAVRDGLVEHLVLRRRHLGVPVPAARQRPAGRPPGPARPARRGGRRRRGTATR